MIILTDCLSEKVDEGCLKVANKLIQYIKYDCPDTKIISCGDSLKKADKHLKLNKLFLNISFFRLLKQIDEEVLYIPFASNTMASIIRATIVSLINEKVVYVLFALQHGMSNIATFFLKNSKFNIVALSYKSYMFYKKLKKIGTCYLKTGIDTKEFIPIKSNEKTLLRKKYGIMTDAKVVLHVGHLQRGRNVESLLNIGENMTIILVLSSVSKQDKKLRKRLEGKKNIVLVDKYLNNIHEVYQLADVYIFPVLEEENCIDVPLSVLEAASCGIPIVCTKYGELREFIYKKGFYFIENTEKYTINKAIDIAINDNQNPRNNITDYDWEESVKRLLNLIRDCERFYE